MEYTQLISEEWCSLSGLNIAEEADFMNQLLGGNSTLWPSNESTNTNTNNNSYFPSNVANSNFFHFSQGSSSSSTDNSGNIFSTTSSGTCSFDPATNFDSMSMDFCLGDSKFSPHIFQWNDNLSQQINVLNRDEEPGLDQGKPVLNDDYNLHAEEDKSRNLMNPAKRSRRSIEEVSENMRNAKSRMIPKSASMSSFNEEDRISVGFQRQGSSSCISEGDSNPSLELNGEASPSLSPKDPTPNRKSRSNSCPATDPQTLYARKRRERINERLRILQSLVPNGTKVDISTMLEEAVIYVKFLQHQIKLLSSDDLWMYASIAYNGINIGLDLVTTKGL